MKARPLTLILSFFFFFLKTDASQRFDFQYMENGDTVTQLLCCILIFSLVWILFGVCPNTCKPFVLKIQFGPKVRV